MAESTGPDMTLGELALALWRDPRLTPSPYALVPEARIVAAREDAFYQRLSAERAFRRGLRYLFEHWTERRAVLFAWGWRLPRRGLVDLRWSRDSWCRSGGKLLELRAGHRMYRAPEQDTKAGMQAVGFRRFPPRLLNDKDLAVGAERLYRRATLRWTWRRIAASEDPYAEDLSGLIKTVRDDVHRWAAAVGVRLPKRAPGRPSVKRGRIP